MPSLKLSVTIRRNLEKKYGSEGLTAIDRAVASWIAADTKRGFQTVHVGLDVKSDLKPFGVAPLQGKPTASKAKKVIDALCKKLAPDYLVLVGSQDVVPHFEVANPTLKDDGDTDPKVPTDNPYACSHPFVTGKRESYLIPDRVVGRIPDLPGATEPGILIEAFAAAAKWVSKPRSYYKSDLLACCHAWRGAGLDCAREIGRPTSRLQISPPAGAATQAIRRRHKGRLHLIKGHGQELDARFYGQRGSAYPELLTSQSLTGRISPATVAGAMCCFGAGLFDPTDPAALVPGELPIPLVYLRQGAYAFAGSTTTAWVGVGAMMCADWVVTGFLKCVLAGASLGRAFLEAKQDFVNWIQKQGAVPDLADEKTLLQFVLLGDPSIHPVLAAAGAGAMAARAVAPAMAALAGMAVTASSPIGAVAASRRARRAFRLDLGRRLAEGLPDRRRVAKLPTRPKGELLAIARLAADQLLDVLPSVAAVAVAGKVKVAKTKKSESPRFEFDFSRPMVQRVGRSTHAPARAALPAATVAAIGAAPPAEQKTVEYYWCARRTSGPVPEIAMISVLADAEDRVLRTRTVVSS